MYVHTYIHTYMVERVRIQIQWKEGFGEKMPPGNEVTAEVDQRKGLLGDPHTSLKTKTCNWKITFYINRLMSRRRADTPG